MAIVGHPADGALALADLVGVGAGLIEGDPVEGERYLGAGRGVLGRDPHGRGSRHRRIGLIIAGRLDGELELVARLPVASLQDLDEPRIALGGLGDVDLVGAAGLVGVRERVVVAVGLDGRRELTVARVGDLNNKLAGILGVSHTSDGALLLGDLVGVGADLLELGAAEVEVDGLPLGGLLALEGHRLLFELGRLVSVVAHGLDGELERIGAEPVAALEHLVEHRAFAELGGRHHNRCSLIGVVEDRVLDGHGGLELAEAVVGHLDGDRGGMLIVGHAGDGALGLADLVGVGASLVEGDLAEGERDLSSGRIGAAAQGHGRGLGHRGALGTRDGEREFVARLPVASGQDLGELRTALGSLGDVDLVGGAGLVSVKETGLVNGDSSLELARLIRNGNRCGRMMRIVGHAGGSSCGLGDVEHVLARLGERNALTKHNRSGSAVLQTRNRGGQLVCAAIAQLHGAGLHGIHRGTSGNQRELEGLILEAVAATECLGYRNAALDRLTVGAARYHGLIRRVRIGERGSGHSLALGAILLIGHRGHNSHRAVVGLLLVHRNRRAIPRRVVGHAMQLIRRLHLGNEIGIGVADMGLVERDLRERHIRCRYVHIHTGLAVGILVERRIALGLDIELESAARKILLAAVIDKVLVRLEHHIGLLGIEAVGKRGDSARNFRIGGLCGLAVGLAVLHNLAGCNEGTLAVILNGHGHGIGFARVAHAGLGTLPLAYGVHILARSGELHCAKGALRCTLRGGSNQGLHAILPLNSHSAIGHGSVAGLIAQFDLELGRGQDLPLGKALLPTCKRSLVERCAICGVLVGEEGVLNNGLCLKLTVALIRYRHNERGGVVVVVHTINALAAVGLRHVVLIGACMVIRNLAVEPKLNGVLGNVAVSHRSLKLGCTSGHRRVAHRNKRELKAVARRPCTARQLLLKGSVHNVRELRRNRCRLVVVHKPRGNRVDTI